MKHQKAKKPINLQEILTKIFAGSFPPRSCNILIPKSSEEASNHIQGIKEELDIGIWEHDNPKKQWLLLLIQPPWGRDIPETRRTFCLYLAYGAAREASLSKKLLVYLLTTPTMTISITFTLPASSQTSQINLFSSAVSKSVFSLHTCRIYILRQWEKNLLLLSNWALFSFPPPSIKNSSHLRSSSIWK